MGITSYAENFYFRTIALTCQRSLRARRATTPNRLLSTTSLRCFLLEDAIAILMRLYLRWCLPASKITGDCAIH
jgi:hypothetical protein